MTTGHNPKFIRRARAKQRATGLKTEARDEPQMVVRSPQPSPKPGYDSHGKFDATLHRIDMASRWLGGYAVEAPGGGLLTRVYPQGAEERECREAMAQLLWDGDCPLELMQLLAMYIAPDGHSYADSDFRVKLEKRRPGATRNSAAVLQVGLMILDDINAGKKIQEGIALAAAYFKIEERQVKTYWSRFQKMHRSGFDALEASRNERPDADE